MNVGDKVQSRLYASKGVGTIIGFNTLFGEQYAEVLFKDGTTLSTKVYDLSLENDPVSLLQNGQVNVPSVFFARNMLLRLDANISENAIVTSTNFKIQPLPHQLLAVDFVINRFEPRSLIADEVGLGKTIEAILVYEEFKLRGIAKKILIVVPSGLVLQWHGELLEKFNEKFIIYTKDYIRTLKQSYGEETNVWKLHDKIIASIDSIKPWKIDDDSEAKERNRREWHNKHIFEDIAVAGFDMVIIDEAHKLSKHGDGHESARFKLGERLSNTIPVLLLLTATPHQGDEYLFLNLLRLIDPVLFASKQSLTPAMVQEVTVRNKKRAAVDFDGKRIFKHRITSLIEINRIVPENQKEIDLYQYVTEYTSQHYNLARRNNNQIMILLVMLYQRMVSSSSFALLDAMKRRQLFLQGESTRLEQMQPETLEEEYEVEELLKKATSTSLNEIETELQFVQTCIRMAQKLTISFKDAKFRKLIVVIDEIKKREQKPDLKFIIFTEFRATQKAIIQFLSQFGYPCSYINGSLSREEKVQQVDMFRTQNQIMVSTDAGGEGINLQFCYCVINFDLPWNPSRLEQRIGRIDRIGQKHDSLIFNFHLTDTVEDRVRRILEIKLERIKNQFGEDKFADVLNLIQDEFSFDQIYIDAVKLKAVEDQQLEAIANKIYKRAKEILDKDELLLPFSQFAQNAKDLVNSELNMIIRQLTLNFLAYKGIPVNWYKDEAGFCYFPNPYHASPEEPAVYRNVTFDNALSMNKANIEFINMEHPLLRHIQQEIEINANMGCITAIRVRINKFQNISGFWFVYRLRITNHQNKKKIAVVSVFMEDESFPNNRISNYLEQNYIEEAALVQNYKRHGNIQEIAETALKQAEEKAGEIFTATQLSWLNEIEQYERKFNDYFRFKRNAYSQIHIDNIRESKLKTLDVEKQEQQKKFQLQRNIVPKLELAQAAYVEFA